MFEKYKDIMTPMDMCQALGIHRSKGYALIADGTIPSFRLGHKICIPKNALTDFVEAQTHMDSIRRAGVQEVV
ncbi:MAG: excisionase family DNA-binding protein [Subdoligranulum sp.]|nr:excisionase family DNA-binding protein [Subdoligranulum sp.]